MRKIKALFAAVLLVALSSNAFAADATVTFVSGKVEVQRDGKWIPLQKGDAVAKSETISTGFQSEVKIKVLDSVMYLGPVTRITLEELSSSGSQDNVNVYLKTGTARSQVKHVDNKRVNYQVHTAVAVASCRGTDWIIDDSNNVEGIEGTIAVAAYQIAPEATVTTSEEEQNVEDAEGEKTEDGKSEDVKTEDGKKDDGKSSDGKSTDGKVADRPTSNEGVLVKANQSVKVSDTNAVSAPVKNVVKKAVEIKSAVSSAAEKTAVGGEKSGVETPKTEAPSAKDPRNNNNKENPTGNLIVTIELPD